MSKWINDGCGIDVDHFEKEAAQIKAYNPQWEHRRGIFKVSCIISDDSETAAMVSGILLIAAIKAVQSIDSINMPDVKNGYIIYKISVD